jgi:hypothetical protein
MDFFGLNNKTFNWLSSIEKTCFNLQKAAAKQLGSSKFDASDKINLKTIISECSRLRAELDREKKNTKLISASPPGFLSAIVDMLHSILVNPSAPSEKQKFYEKIDSLVERQYRSQHLVNNEIGVSGDDLETIIKAVFLENPFSKELLPFLHEQTSTFFGNLLDDRELKLKKPKLNDTIASVLSSLPANLRSAYVKLLPSVLESLQKITSKEKKSLLQKKNNELAGILSSLQIKEASIEEFQSFWKQFENLKEKQKDLIKGIDSAFSKASKGLLLGPSKQKFNLEEKKYNYLSALIYSTEKKISIIMELLSKLQLNEKSESKSTSSNSESKESTKPTDTNSNQENLADENEDYSEDYNYEDDDDTISG